MEGSGGEEEGCAYAYWVIAGVASSASVVLLCLLLSLLCLVLPFFRYLARFNRALSFVRYVASLFCCHCCFISLAPFILFCCCLLHMLFRPSCCSSSFPFLASIESPLLFRSFLLHIYAPHTQSFPPGYNPTNQSFLHGFICFTPSFTQCSNQI